MRSYRLVGAYLVLVGATLLLLGLLLTGIVVHSALGISCLIMGVTLLLIPFEERWRAASRALAMMLMDSYANMERLLKELDLRGPAMYARMRVGGFEGVRALVSRGEVNPPSSDVSGLLYPGGGSYAVVLVPPGYTLLAYARDRGLAPPSGDVATLEALLNACLVDVAEVCESVLVKPAGEELVVSVNGCLEDVLNVAEPYPRAKSCLGSPYASIAALMASYVLGAGVRVLSENREGSRLVVRLRLYE